LILAVTVIVLRYIAMITKQKSFNKSLVDQNSQVIFLDEAHVGMLDPDDWKILTQGGLTAHDRKYKKTTPAVIRCPMFITCQKELDFGAGVRRAVHERESEVERARVRVLEETKSRWISLGMMREDAAHLLQSVEGPYHPAKLHL
jgi:hypothetical protein